MNTDSDSKRKEVQAQNLNNFFEFGFVNVAPNFYQYRQWTLVEEFDDEIFLANSIDDTAYRFRDAGEAWQLFMIIY